MISESVNIILICVFFALIFGVFMGIFIYFIEKRKNNKIINFLGINGLSEWPIKRIYIDEETIEKNFFIDPISGKKVHYDYILPFNEQHQPPAHIEISINARIEYLRYEKTAYVSLQTLKTGVYSKSTLP